MRLDEGSDEGVAFEGDRSGLNNAGLAIVAGQAINAAMSSRTLLFCKLFTPAMGAIA